MECLHAPLGCRRLVEEALEDAPGDPHGALVLAEDHAEFDGIAVAAMTADIGRGGEKDPPTDPAIIFAGMLQQLETDPLWAREYEDFVRQVSFAGAGTIHFADALAAVRRVVVIILQLSASSV